MHEMIQIIRLRGIVSAVVLLKEPEARNEEELLQEDLRVEDSDVGRPANQGVSCVGQGVDDIVAHEVTVFALKHW